MRSVSIARFKDSLSEFVAAAEAGEEVVVTRHGKPTVRLIAFEEDPKTLQAKIIDELVAFGKDNRHRFGPTTTSEISGWIREGRRWAD
jgi:prevent-host-death family protein